MPKYTVELHRYIRFRDTITLKAKTPEEAAELAQKVRSGLELNYENGGDDYFDRGIIVWSDDESNEVPLYEKDTDDLATDD